MTTLSIPSDLLVQLATPIWESVLGMSAAARPHDDLRTLPAELVARVDIRGAWCGSVFLAASHQFARHAAARMFSSTDAAIDETDLRDALGELANMVAGAAKSVLPEPSRLTIPVVRQADASASNLYASGRLLTQVSFQCGEGRVQAVLVENCVPAISPPAEHPPAA